MNYLSGIFEIGSLRLSDRIKFKTLTHHQKLRITKPVGVLSFFKKPPPFFSWYYFVIGPNVFEDVFHCFVDIVGK